MAATRLIAMHINKGKTLAQCLEARTDYAQNPEKTEKGNLLPCHVVRYREMPPKPYGSEASL